MPSALPLVRSPPLPLHRYLSRRAMEEVVEEEEEEEKGEEEEEEGEEGEEGEELRAQVRRGGVPGASSHGSLLLPCCPESSVISSRCLSLIAGFLFRSTEGVRYNRLPGVSSFS